MSNPDKLGVNHVSWQTRTLNHFSSIFFVFILLNAFSAFAGPARTTYQAKIIKPDGYPLEASSVNFKFTILDPAGSCILYSETYSAVNMNSTGGVISFSLGSGVKTYPASSPAFADVFSNITPNLSCDVGGPVSYSPLANDIRKIVMQFHDGSGWQTLPAMSINAVPYAMYADDAQKLGGVSATAFVQDADLATCSAGQALYYNGTSFSCVAIGGTGVTSSTIAAALGYTPADNANVSVITSNVSSVSSSVFSVSATVSSLASSVSTLTNSVAVSFSAIVSSQWVSSGTALSYSSGNVGIGTSSPEAAQGKSLHVYNDLNDGTVNSNSVVISQSVNRNAYFVAISSGTGNSNGGIIFRHDSASNISDGGEIVYNHTTKAMQFKTSGTEVVRITSGGAVGIGTNAPTRKLQIGTGTASLKFDSFYAGSSFTNVMYGSDFGSYIEAADNGHLVVALRDNDNNDGFRIISGGNNYMSDNNYDTAVFSALANGNIGIGLAAPTAKLHMSGGTPLTASLKFTSGTLLTSPQSGSVEYDGFNLYFTDGTNTRRTISTDATSLSSSAITTALGYTPANSSTVVSLSNTVAALSATVSAIPASQWSTSGSTINYANKVGIGTSNPATNLDVSGTAKISGQVLLGNNPATGGVFNFGPLLGGNVGYNGPFFLQETFTNLSAAHTVGHGVSIKLNSAVSSTGLVFSGLNYMQVQPGSTAGYGSLYGDLAVMENGGNGNVSDITGMSALALQNGLGSVIVAQAVNGRTYTYGGSVQNQYGGNFGSANAGGQVTNNFGVSIDSALGVFTNNYGLYVNDQSVATASQTYNIYSAGSNSNNIFMGRVGIGTTTPTAKLQIAAGTSTTTAFKFTSGTLLAAPASGSVEYDGFNYYITDGTNTRRTVATDSSVAAAVSAVAASQWTTSGTAIHYLSGNIGVGTSNPAAALNIVNSTDREMILLKGAVGQNGPWLRATDSNGVNKLIISQNASMPQFSLGSSDAIRLTSEYIGFNEVPSGALVHATGNLSFFNGLAPSQKTVLGYYNQTSALSALEIANPSSGFGNLLLMRSGGYVGVGVTSPAQALDVSGTAKATKFYAGDGAFNSASITFANNTNTGFYNASGNLGISIGGALKGTWSTGSLGFNAGGAGPQIYFTGGNEAQPAYAFNVDSDTGMFNPNASGGSNELAFSTSGTEKVRISSTGYVGIGTSSPAFPLQVNGAAAIGTNITGYTNSANNFILGNSNSLTNAGGGNANTISVVGNSNAVSTTLMNFSYNLSVLGNNNFVGNAGNSMIVGLNNNVTAANSFTFGFGITNNTAGAMMLGPIDSAKITILATNRVGIGTAAPTSLLTVGAGTSSTAAFKLNSGVLLSTPQSGVFEYDGSNYYITNGSSVRRMVATVSGAGNFDSVSTLSSTGNITAIPTGSLIVSSTTASTNSTTGALIVNGGVGIQGNVFTSGNISITGQLTSKDFFEKSISMPDGWAIDDYVEIVQATPTAAGGSSVWEINLSGTRNSWTESSTYKIAGTHAVGSGWREAPHVSDNGYVGNSKCFTVDVNGNGNNPQFRIRALKASASCGVAGTPLPLNFRIRSIGNNSAWSSLSTTGTGGVSVGMQSMGLSWNMYTGNPQLNGQIAIHANPYGMVGIGNAAPVVALDVTAHASAAENIRLRGRGSGVEGGQITFMDAIGTGAWEVDSYGANGLERLRFYRDKGENNVNEPFSIAHTGYIGVGTSSPTAQLTIGSTNNINTGSNFSNAVGALRIQDGSSIGLLFDSNQIEQLDTSNYLYLNYNSSASTIVNYGGGNVGIGMVPGVKLDVSASGATLISNGVGGVFKISNPSSANSDYFQVGWLSEDNWAIMTADSGTHRNLVVTPWGGNLGVGNVSPTYKLDVSGDIRITGTPYRNGGDSNWIVPSDARLKDVVSGYNRGLREIANIDTIIFNYKKDNPKQIDSTIKYTGVLAQQVQQQIPEAVNTDKDGFLSLNTGPIFWAMVNAIKEIYHEVLGIKAENAQLKGQVEFQARKIQSLEEENAAVKERLERIEKALQTK